jgi:hypothetical protein
MKQSKVWIYFTFVVIFLGVFGVVNASSTTYPDGTLVRAKDADEVYYIEGGKKQHVVSPRAFDTRFTWDRVVLSSQEDLANLAEGPKLTFREGTLLAYGGSVYVVSDGKARPIASADIFTRLGYKWKNVINISRAELDLQGVGNLIASAEILPNGTLIKEPGGRVFLLENGYKRYVPSPLIFQARFKWDELVNVSESDLAKYPDAAALFYPDGLIIASATSVYVMEGNYKRPIGSPEIFESYGMNWGQVRRATDYEISIIPDGDAFHQLKTYANGTLVWNKDTNETYVFENGSLLKISSDQLFNRRNYRRNAILTFPNRVINTYAKAGYVKYPDGSLISDGSRVYLIEGGNKRWISGPDVFTGRGYRWGDVLRVNQEELDSHPTGMVLSSTPAVEYLDGYRIPSTVGKVAKEQHLWLADNQSSEDHYNMTGAANTSAIRNGMAGGFGAFGPLTSADILEEKYYITMRWNYVNWYEARSNLASGISNGNTELVLNNTTDFPSTGYVMIGNEVMTYSGKSGNTLTGLTRGYDGTVTSSYNAGARVVYVYKYGSAWKAYPFKSYLNDDANATWVAKNWHKKKKVLVTNPNTGKQLVASVLESGPAIWTGRVAGLSPEAMEALGANTNDTLEYGWVVDQNRSVGPVN